MKCREDRRDVVMTTSDGDQTSCRILYQLEATEMDVGRQEVSCNSPALQLTNAWTRARVASGVRDRRIVRSWRSWKKLVRHSIPQSQRSSPNCCPQDAPVVRGIPGPWPDICPPDVYPLVNVRVGLGLNWSFG